MGSFLEQLLRKRLVLLSDSLLFLSFAWFLTVLVGTRMLFFVPPIATDARFGHESNYTQIVTQSRDTYLAFPCIGDTPYE